MSDKSPIIYRVDSTSSKLRFKDNVNIVTCVDTPELCNNIYFNDKLVVYYSNSRQRIRLPLVVDDSEYIKTVLSPYIMEEK